MVFIFMIILNVGLNNEQIRLKTCKLVGQSCEQIDVTFDLIS